MIEIRQLAILELHRLPFRKKRDTYGIRTRRFHRARRPALCFLFSHNFSFTPGHPEEHESATKDLCFAIPNASCSPTRSPPTQMDAAHSALLPSPPHQTSFP